MMVPFVALVAASGWFGSGYAMARLAIEAGDCSPQLEGLLPSVPTRPCVDTAFRSFVEMALVCCGARDVPRAECAVGMRV